MDTQASENASHAEGFSADYAEMFETIDGNSITPGRFITLQGKKVRIATSADSYILGITSAASSIKGDAAELHWHHKYLKDQWGRTQYEQIHIDPNDENLAKLTCVAPKLNPANDSKQFYLPRSKREEWVTVGLLGQLLVTDDGSCSIDGYCLPNDEGIATFSETGYRVMDRISSDQILVMFKSMDHFQGVGKYDGRIHIDKGEMLNYKRT
ncbi:hypothetical protein LCM23_16725 [Cytobacillus kochii]|nr:peptidase G2 autoproteolytic cleavage domain-containing protein [Cytobacillus kochii]MCA1027742.1 hypothetical protein [Cytobacillus kochii]